MSLMLSYEREGVTMLNVILLITLMPSVVKLSVITHAVIMLSVIFLSFFLSKGHLLRVILSIAVKQDVFVPNVNMLMFILFMLSVVKLSVIMLNVIC